MVVTKKHISFSRPEGQRPLRRSWRK